MQEESSGGGGQVLVVDDDEAVLMWLSVELEGRGWQVDQAASGRECLRYCQKKTPDLVILDLMMPGLSGLDVASILRGRGYRGPVLLFSGYLVPEVAKRAKRLDLEPISKLDHEALYRRLGTLMPARVSHSPS